MSPASYQTAPPRDATCDPAPPVLPLSAATPSRAGNGTRTRDPNLGKVVLYQLSYSRERTEILAAGPRPRNRSDPAPVSSGTGPAESGGEGDRTPDLVNAIHALSQLSYAPVLFSTPGGARQLKRAHGAVSSVYRLVAPPPTVDCPGPPKVTLHP